MSPRRDLRKKIEELRKAHAEEFGGEAQVRAILERLRWAIMDEMSKLRAFRFQRATEPEDRTLPPEAEELWGEDRSRWKVKEKAASRVLDDFDEYMATPMANTGDLTPYTEDLAHYEKERLLEEAVRQLAEMASRIKRDKRG
jgi:hypothetical protein